MISFIKQKQLPTQKKKTVKIRVRNITKLKAQRLNLLLVHFCQKRLTCLPSEPTCSRCTMSAHSTPVYQRTLQMSRPRLTEESEHEDAVVSYPQLVGVFEVVSGHEVVFLQRQQDMRSNDSCFLLLPPNTAERRGDVPRPFRWPGGRRPRLCSARPRRRRVKWWRRCTTEGWEISLLLPCIQRTLRMERVKRVFDQPDACRKRRKNIEFAV